MCHERPDTGLKVRNMEPPEKSQQHKSSNFLSDLISKASKPKSVKATYLYTSDLDRYERPHNLSEIMGLEKESLSESASETLDELEKLDTRSGSPAADYNDFKWKLTAFMHIQDIFDCRLYPVNTFLNMYHIWYFYYESKYILIESLLCGLNGFYSASNLLLRVFLEFCLLQNYYYRIVDRSESYEPLQKYFTSRIHPNWNSVLNGAFPRDSFSKPIKFRLDMHLKGLSESCAHPYHPDLSPKHDGSFVPGPSLVGIYFWYSTKTALDAVLWAYYVNFPMLFHPVDPLTKFGFRGPVGWFIDKVGGHVIRKSLPDADFKAFLDYSAKQNQVETLLDWYNSLRTLTDREILATWDNDLYGPIKHIHEGYCKQMAYVRALKESMALLPAKVNGGGDQETDLSNLFQYSKWRNIYKRLTKEKKKPE